MRLIFEHPRPERIFHTTWRSPTHAGRIRRFPAYMGVCSHGLWWLEQSKRWVVFEEARDGTEDYSSHFEGVRTVRAFARRVREWERYVPKGTRFKLVSSFAGHDVTAITERRDDG